jgi:hypothetical protein
VLSLFGEDSVRKQNHVFLPIFEDILMKKQPANSYHLFLKLFVRYADSDIFLTLPYEGSFAPSKILDFQIYKKETFLFYNNPKLGETKLFVSQRGVKFFANPTGKGFEWVERPLQVIKNPIKKDSAKNILYSDAGIVLGSENKFIIRG